jgi:hypothetical protein
VAKTSFQLNPDEKEVIEGFANKIGFFGGGGGKLVLTNHRLLFTNRRKNQIKMEMPLANTLHVGKASSATIWSVALLFTLFMSNAIRVTMRGGSSQRFVVSNKDRWVDLIEEYRRKTQA